MLYLTAPLLIFASRNCTPYCVFAPPQQPRKGSVLPESTNLTTCSDLLHGGITWLCSLDQFHSFTATHRWIVASELPSLIEELLLH